MIKYVNSERAGQALADGGYPEDLIVILPEIEIVLSEDRAKAKAEAEAEEIERSKSINNIFPA